MRQSWSEVWRFETANLAVVAEVTPCEDDPADSFDSPEDIAMIRDGRVDRFDARVRVLLRNDEDTELGADYLGCCAYDKPEDLFRHHAGMTAEHKALKVRFGQAIRNHRRSEAAECRKRIGELNKVLRNNASLNPPVTYCNYGPDMVRIACEAARVTLANMRAIRLRESA